MAGETKRVALVGAGGFLGTTLLDRAVNRASVEIVAVVRSPRSLPMILGRSKQIVITGGRKADLVDVLRGVDAVIDVSVGPAQEIAESARIMAAACREAGVRQLVYTSSAAAQPVKRRPWAAAKPGSLYGREKAAAEREFERLREAGVSVTIVRPGLIWGPRSLWTIRHLDELLRGTVIAPASQLEGPPPLAYAPNLADGLLNVATSRLATDRKLDFFDPWWHSWEEYARVLAAAVGLSDRVRLATRMRPGPWRALAVEAVSERPRLKKTLATSLERAPSSVNASVRARLRSPSPPAHVTPLLDSDVVSSGGTARMLQRDLDVFLRWALPDADGRELFEPLGTSTREAAIAETVAWAHETGFVPASLQARA